MPMPKKSAAAEPSFEEALARLEEIVDSMESGETPLSELVARFEEGNKLLTQCQKRLKEAELKIEKLRAEKDQLTLESFEEDAADAHG